MNSKQSEARISEAQLIRKYFAPFANKGAFNLKDDAARLSPVPDTDYVITQDAIAEGIHFFAEDPPDQIARKALRVNLSDIAAKGGHPKYISLALGLGTDWNEEWIAAFAKGLQEDCTRFGVELTGGDTFSTGSGFIISITKIGEIPKNQYVSRIGAKPADAIFVTGSIGDAALGLKARLGGLKDLDETSLEVLLDRYLLPRPRMELARLIRKFATSSMDISDGFVGDLEKLCDASGVSAVVNLADIPLSEAVSAAVRLESNALETALSGGDDYEILFTANADNSNEILASCSSWDFNISQVGEIVEGEGVKVFDTKGEVMEFKNKSYDHSGERS